MYRGCRYYYMMARVLLSLRLHTPWDEFESDFPKPLGAHTAKVLCAGSGKIASRYLAIAI